jgi:hypothetical protein
MLFLPKDDERPHRVYLNRFRIMKHQRKKLKFFNVFVTLVDNASENRIQNRKARDRRNSIIIQLKNILLIIEKFQEIQKYDCI